MKYIINLLFYLFSFCLSFSQNQLTTAPLTMPLTIANNLNYINAYQYITTSFAATPTEYGLQITDDRPNLLSAAYFNDIDLLDYSNTGGFSIEFTYDIGGKGYKGKYGMGFVLGLFSDTQDFKGGSLCTSGAPGRALGYDCRRNLGTLNASSSDRTTSLGLQKGFLGFGFDLSGEFKNLYDLKTDPTYLKSGIPFNVQSLSALNSTSSITVKGGVGQISITPAGYPVYSSVITNITSNNKFILAGLGNTNKTASNKGQYIISTDSSKPFDIMGGVINPIPGSNQFRRAKISYLPGTATRTFFYSIKILVGNTWNQVMPWTFVPMTVDYYFTGGTYGNSSTVLPLQEGWWTFPYIASLSDKRRYPLRIALTATTGANSGAKIYIRDLSVTAPLAPNVLDYIVDRVSLPKSGSTYIHSIDGATGYASANSTISTNTVTDPALSPNNVQYNTVRLMALNETTGYYEPVSGVKYTIPAGTFSYDSAHRTIKFTASEGIVNVPQVSIGYDILGTNGIRSRTGKIVLNVVDNGYVHEDDIVNYVKING